jgi:hypothetical protein
MTVRNPTETGLFVPVSMANKEDEGRSSEARVDVEPGPRRIPPPPENASQTGKPLPRQPKLARVNADWRANAKDWTASRRRNSTSSAPPSDLSKSSPSSSSSAERKDASKKSPSRNSDSPAPTTKSSTTSANKRAQINRPTRRQNTTGLRGSAHTAEQRKMPAYANQAKKVPAVDWLRNSVDLQPWSIIRFRSIRSVGHTWFTTLFYNHLAICYNITYAIYASHKARRGLF